MIFEYILGQLDGELARWRQLRVIVAKLATPAIQVAPFLKSAAEPVQVPEPELLTPAVEAAPLPETTPAPLQGLEHSSPTPARRRPRLFKSRGRVPTPRAPEITALTGVIPAGPVVVSATVLREREAERQRTASAINSQPLDPEVLLRELSQRWGTGASAS